MEKSIERMLAEMRKAAAAPAVVASKSPFRSLVSTLLSQRTRDSNTAKATERLFSKYKTPEEMENAPLSEIRRLITPAGFYKVKAKRIKKISRQLVKRFQGKVPAGLDALLSLPGVGRKTANCVLVYGFGIAAIPVDVHVHRISNRIGLVSTSKPKQTEKELSRKVPKRFWLGLNHAMVRFGQSVCTPRNPKCGACSLKGECDYFLAGGGKRQF